MTHRCAKEGCNCRVLTEGRLCSHHREPQKRPRSARTPRQKERRNEVKRERRKQSHGTLNGWEGW